MKLNDISLPYPVLRQGSDDIIPSLPNDCIKIKVESNVNTYYFKIELKFDNEDIKKLILQGKAEYTCEVDCPRTVWRQSFCSKFPEFEIQIPRKNLSGNIKFSSYVSVKEAIPNYYNSGFNSDYGDASFDMECGDILVGFPAVSHHVDIKYDKLQAAGSFMTIRKDIEHNEVNFNFEHDKIEINLPQDMFEQYQNGLKTNFAEIMHASLAYNALTCALYELCNSNKDLMWVNAILYRLQHEEQLSDFYDSETGQINDVPAVAVKLLRDPYRRLFQNLANQINDNIE